MGGWRKRYLAEVPVVFNGEENGPLVSDRAGFGEERVWGWGDVVAHPDEEGFAEVACRQEVVDAWVGKRWIGWVGGMGWEGDVPSREKERWGSMAWEMRRSPVVRMTRWRSWRLEETSCGLMWMVWGRRGGGARTWGQSGVIPSSMYAAG